MLFRSLGGGAGFINLNGEYCRGQESGGRVTQEKIVPQKKVLRDFIESFDFVRMARFTHFSGMPSDAFASAIAETQRSLSMDTIDAAVEAIVNASQVMLYGVGGSAVVIHAAQHLFVKAGIPCACYHDGYMQTVTAAIMRKGSVAIGVSTLGATKNVVDALKIALKHGATTIGITSNRESALAKVSQICLVIPGGDRNVPLYGDFLEAKMCQLYIMDLLYLRILFKMGEISKKALKETAEALRTYYNPVKRVKT